MSVRAWLFGTVEPPPPMPSQDEIKLIETERRVNDAIREAQHVSAEMRELSEVLRMLLDEYRRVGR
jgi:hypothetical protein